MWKYAPDGMADQLVNDTDIYSKLNFSVDKTGVTVGNLNLSDVGTFTLTATNEAGQRSASVQLIIHGTLSMMTY